MSARMIVAVFGMLAATLSGSSAASAFDRTATLATHNGTYTKSVEASCADGRCSRDAEVTGPNGRTISRSTTCGATWRFYGCGDTIAGPNGGSVNRHFVGRRLF